MSAAKKKNKIKVPANIEELVPYPPGKPIEELERELGISDSIKLASNENPLGPSRSAILKAMGVLGDVNRYPDGSCFYLKEKAAASFGVLPENLIFGNGSNEIIELLLRTFADGGEVLFGEPSFAVYPIISKACGAIPVSVPLTKDLKIDLKAMAEKVTKKTKVVFIANPNNPTGTYNTADEVTEFLDNIPEDVIVCLDEAYYEYVTADDFPKSVKYVLKERAVVVLRTFSKIYGLAGLRIGYAITRPDIVEYIDRVRQPFNVSSIAQAAAIGALRDESHVEASRKLNENGFNFLLPKLKELDFKTVDSQANFFLINVGDGEKVYNDLLKKGVIVRPMKGYKLPEYIRITIGTQAENERFIEALCEVTGRALK
ncbi:MAG: histidinol-phosphate transaminase [Deltaproteobacteria bacterium]|nr:histidinol-phosphate transaminase [Deltaproteobacteria bacterium]